MTWAWHGAYLQSINPNELIDAIDLTLKNVTSGRLVHAEPKNDRVWPNLPEVELVCVSPEHNGWTAFWGLTYPFCAQVFQQRALTGLLIGGEDEEFEGDTHTRHWTYMIWENGMLTDWFVSHPNNYFQSWSLARLNDYALNYLHRRNFATHINEIKRHSQFRELIADNPNAFIGQFSVFRRVTQTKISRATYKEWISLPTISALEKLPEIIPSPFAGPAYHVVPVAAHKAVKNGRITLATQPRSQDERILKHYYDWATTKIYLIDQMTLLRCQWFSAEPSATFNQYGEFFYWS